MKISLVVPSYNQARFLEETLCSILMQRDENLELIVVDGGSTDGSREIIQAFRPHLAHAIVERDRGQADAINKGMRLASGDVVGWLNSDDLLMPGALAAARRHFSKFPEAVVVYGDYLKIDEQSRVLAYRRQPTFHLGVCRYAYQTVPQPGSFYRASAWQAVGGIDEQLHFSLDYDLIMRLGAVGKVLHAGRCMSAFRLHNESKSVSRAEAFATDHDYVWKKNFGLDSKQLSFQVRRKLYRLLLVARMAMEGCLISRVRKQWEVNGRRLERGKPLVAF